MDDDHIGSLKTLIYYRYFVHGLETKVVSGTDMISHLKNYLNINKVMSGGKMVSTQIVDVYNIKYIHKLQVQAIKTNHMQDSYGLCVIESDKTLFISGDTKADSCIESSVVKVLEELKNYLKDHSLIVLHDYSEYNYPSKNVHACDNDIEIEYSDEFKKNMIYYHYDNAKVQEKLQEKLKEDYE
jgi:hypothetical protein